MFQRVFLPYVLLYQMTQNHGQNRDAYQRDQSPILWPSTFESYVMPGTLLSIT